MDERAACALLKSRFEAAGYQIEENTPFDEAGITFDIDGFDSDRRVGYEYVSAEAGDGWDVDGAVIAALAERREQGELFVLVVEEADAPDAAALGAKIDAFLRDLPKPDAKKPAAKKPAAKKPPPIPKKPATKPAGKKRR